MGFVIAAGLLAALISCQKAGTQNAMADRPDNTAAANIGQEVNTAAPAANTSAPNSGSATDAYKAAHAARKNHDIAALKKLMSKDILEFMTELGKADEKKKLSLDEMLRDMSESPQAPTAEARNEKINGNTATIEYLDENGKWRTMDLVKEDGVWKLTIALGDDKPTQDKPKGKK